MQPFRVHTGLVAPLARDNVDTDQIIPAQFLKRIERTGFGPMLFYRWRFDAEGAPNPQFVLNEPRYQGASILVAGENFGCGSSREHAPWALMDYGFRAVIAPSFGDIFYNNCLQNGLLPVRLEKAAVAGLLEHVQAHEGAKMTVDLEEQTIRLGHMHFGFTIDAASRQALLEGLDRIGRTLALESTILEFEARHQHGFQKA